MSFTKLSMVLNIGFKQKKKKRKEMYRDNESSLSEYTLLLKLTDTLLVTMLINHLIIQVNSLVPASYLLVLLVLY